MTDISQIKTLAVIACAGTYPRLVIEGAKRAGVRVVGIGAKGAVNREEIEPLCDVYREFRAGEMDIPLRWLQDEGVHHIMLAGQIKPSVIYTLRPDAEARRLLRELDRRNAHSLFTTLCNYLRDGGIEVLPGTTFMEANMPQEGYAIGPELTEAELADARYGLDIARRIAQLDIGQSVVVDAGRVLAVESYKGTNECIEAGGHRGHGVTLCKVTKAGHDMRFDIPCLGMGTLLHCLHAGVKRVVFEAGKTILFDREQVEALCEEYGISLLALPAPATGEEPEITEHLEDDAAHARALAREMESMQVGCCAVVCDGVVLAVDDSDGVEKCIRRAAAYMARLRLARFIGWVAALLTGRADPPPAPMTLACTRPLTPAESRAARRARMQVAEG